MKTLTISQAKWEVSNYLLDTWGFDAEPLIDKVNKASTIAELRSTVIEISAKPEYGKKVMLFWGTIAGSIKA